MKKAFNLFAALAFAAGAAVAPQAQARIEWACVKNDTWRLMKFYIYASHQKKSLSKPTQPVQAGRTGCIKIPEGAHYITFWARTINSNTKYKARRYVDLPANSKHDHISVNLKPAHWWAHKYKLEGGPWEWTGCDRCEYNRY